MKLSKISLAVAAACGVLSAPAFAISASNYNNASEFSGSTLNIRVSGATAQDNGILGSALSLCVAGTVHRYSISNNFVFFCQPDVGTNAGQITVPTRSGGTVTQLAIYKYSVGGSAFGVTPLNSTANADGSALGANGANLPFLDLAKLAASCTGTFATSTAAATFSTSLGTYVNISCSNPSSAVTTLATTYIGLSDVEPAFFAANTSNLTSSNVYSLIFGVPVSKNIYTALQTQQGLAAGDADANMPSLTSAQLTSAYTQGGQTWAGIGVTSGLADDGIYVARRVDSSGTQKTFEALIAKTPNGEPFKSCATGVDLFVTADSGLQNTSGGDSDTLCNLASGQPTVFAGSGGGNVRNCLINHNANNRGAIGILTTEDKFGSANWRFVKVDGVAPTQANVAAGKYRFYVESALNVRNTGSGSVLSTAAASGYTAVVNRLKSDFANTTIIKAINGADQTFGPAGLMALLSSQSPQPAPDFTGASSINPWTKLVGGATLNNCQAPKANF